MKTVEYNVSGLAGAESKTKLNNSLDEIEGVQKTAINVALGKVTVEYNEPATQDVIKNCIQKTGYDIK